MSTPTMAAPSAVVAGAPRLPLPFGLFSVVVVVEATADHWEAGVVWETLTCSQAGQIGQWLCPPDLVTGIPLSLDKHATPLGEASPFTVYGHYRCSPIGHTLAYAQDRANEHLAVREEQAVEEALWHGTVGNVPNLLGSQVVSATAVAPSYALGALESHVASQYGGQGVIHMTRAGATVLLAENALRVSGNRLFTALGTPVVAGSGYSGEGPAGESAVGEEWMYVTPQLIGYRSPVLTSSNREGDLLDRGKNDLYAVAERSYLVGWDDCGVAAINVNLSGKVVP